MTSLQERLFAMQDKQYAAFQAKLTPGVMVAWFFATALAKQWDQAIPYIEQRRLAPWTHNKTIQKAIESYRITPEQKEYLRTLKIK